jgi:hypothetical protein
MYINTKTVGNKNEILHEHHIDLTETEVLSIKIVNDIFNEITDAIIHSDDFVNFKNGTMVADDVMFMSSMLNSIVDYIKEE